MSGMGTAIEFAVILSKSVADKNSVITFSLVQLFSLVLFSMFSW